MRMSRYNYFVPIWRKNFLPKRRCQPKNLNGVKAHKTVSYVFTLSNGLNVFAASIMEMLNSPSVAAKHAGSRQGRLLN
jgi:hypothetical protein